MSAIAAKAPVPKIIFIATEDWFFASHFLPMVRAALECGFEPVVVARVRKHRAVIEASGARVIPLEAERRSLNPLGVLASVHRLAAILRCEKPALVHCIALRSILVGGAAARIAGVAKRIFALTGGGFLGARYDRSARAATDTIRWTIRTLLTGKETRFLFENPHDARMLGLDPHESNVTIVGGAGVDPQYFQSLPLPPDPPLRVALVARMLWSKGVDLAVEAVRQARREGHDVRLSLFGDPDPSNPRAIPRSMLESWSAEEGIEWRGFSSDVRNVWAEHHVACLPSRGGEGLPRTLLEAAACGRPILTTNVPGCADFVRNGLDGYVVPSGDAAALGRKLVTLAQDTVLLDRMGASARERVKNGYTEHDVISVIEDLYRRAYGERPVS